MEVEIFVPDGAEEDEERGENFPAHRSLFEKGGGKWFPS